MLDKTSSIICAFGLAAAAPRSPYRHLELCGIALKTPHRGCTQCTAPVGCFVSGIAFITRNAVASLVVQQGDLADGRIVGVVEVESGLGVGQLESVADGAVQVDLALVDEVDDGLETVVLQAAAANVQLFAGDDELVDLIGGDAEAHGDDAACVAGGLAGGQETAMEAGAVDDDRRAVAIGQLLSAGDDILGLGVDDVGSAVLEGGLQLGLVDVHDDDLAGAVQVDDAQHAAAQSAGTDDHNGVLELQLGTAASLHGDGGGLDHNGILVAQAVGQDINVALGHGHVLAAEKAEALLSEMSVPDSLPNPHLPPARKDPSC